MQQSFINYFFLRIKKLPASNRFAVTHRTLLNIKPSPISLFCLFMPAALYELLIYRSQANVFLYYPQKNHFYASCSFSAIQLVSLYRLSTTENNQTQKKTEDVLG